MDPLFRYLVIPAIVGLIAGFLVAKLGITFPTDVVIATVAAILSVIVVSSGRYADADV